MTSSYRYIRSSSSPSQNQIEHEENGCRLYVTDLSSKCTKIDIEKAFEKWPLIEIWHAQASCFAFVVLRRQQDGQEAINELDGRWIADAKVRVSLARPRTRRIGERRNFDSNIRCYQCGARGHLSRDCEKNQQNSQWIQSSRLRDQSSRSRSRNNQRHSPYPTSGYFTSPPRTRFS